MEIENLISEVELEDLRRECEKRYNGKGEDTYGHVIRRGLQALREGKYDPTRAPFGAYLYGIIDSAAEDVLRENGYIKIKKQRKASWVRKEMTEGELEMDISSKKATCYSGGCSQWHSFEAEHPGSFEALESAVSRLRAKIKGNSLLSEIFELRILSGKDLSLNDIAMRLWNKQKQKRVSVAAVRVHENKLAKFFADELSIAFGKRIPVDVVLKFFKDKKEQKENRDSDLTIKHQSIQRSLFLNSK